jgi:VWFA-related protein
MGVSSIVTTGVVTAAFIGLTSVLAQGGPPQQSPTFRRGVDLVPLYVSVGFEPGVRSFELNAQDFVLLDRGQPAEIGAFAAVSQTVALKLLIDDCRRMARHEAVVRVIAEELIDSLRPGDQAGVASYRYWGSPFTGDRAQLGGALDLLLKRPRFVCDNWRSWTGLDRSQAGFNAQVDRKDSVLASLWNAPGYERWSVGRIPDARSIMVLSSGMDFRNPDPDRDLAAEAEAASDLNKRNDAIARDTLKKYFVVLAFGFEGAGVDRRLQKLAEDSGGWFVEARRDIDLREATRQMIASLHRRYLIGFVPAVLDGQEHSLAIRVNRPGVNARVRKSYLAPTK